MKFTATRQRLDKKGRLSAMALTGVLSAGWRQFLNALQPDYRQRLIEVLRNEYVDEAQDVVQFEEHARRMHYPHFRERLLRIARSEERRVGKECRSRWSPCQ